jgi:hypothetical protein
VVDTIETAEASIDSRIVVDLVLLPEAIVIPIVLLRDITTGTIHPDDKIPTPGPGTIIKEEGTMIELQGDLTIRDGTGMTLEEDIGDTLNWRIVHFQRRKLVCLGAGASY